MTWLIAFGLAAVVLIGLRASGRCNRMVIEFAAAMLLLGLAGFAWQVSTPPKTADDFAEAP